MLRPCDGFFLPLIHQSLVRRGQLNLATPLQEPVQQQGCNDRVCFNGGHKFTPNFSGFTFLSQFSSFLLPTLSHCLSLGHYAANGPQIEKQGSSVIRTGTVLSLSPDTVHCKIMDVSNSQIQTQNSIYVTSKNSVKRLSWYGGREVRDVKIHCMFAHPERVLGYGGTSLLCKNVELFL